MRREVVLLTGPTGFIGSQVARRILGERDCRMVALVRAEDEEAAARRLSRSWSYWPGLSREIGERVEVMRGDVSLDHLGFNPGSLKELIPRLTHIVHTAADVTLDRDLDELRKTNVQGTANVLELARRVHEDHGLARFSHVSTAYVAGGRRDLVPESALTDEHGFLSNYERSKYEAEVLISKARSELPISVFRLGMVVGDSQTGYIRTFNVIYYPIRLYLTRRPRIVPVSRSLRVNMVPVDYVSEAIVTLTFDPAAEGLNFHLVAPFDKLPDSGDFVNFVRDWARVSLGLRIPRPLFVPLAREKVRTPPRGGEGLLGELSVIAPYLGERRQFDRANVDRLLGEYALDWREFLPRLLDYAVRMSFMHRSDRTVHEQILLRMTGRSRPVAYHDVIEGRDEARTAAEVKKDVIAAAASLARSGVVKGDRIAVVGLNSTRYLTIDVAIGLVGAVSVPLYYTSPPSEISAILKDSEAKMLFVGDRRILSRLEEIETDVPIVVFCRGCPAGSGRRTRSWEEFLVAGEGGELPAASPVTFCDAATVRYTSSTTGTPKGVVFNHEHLRWMAETIVSLFPWEARTRRVSYLSFLPMNHVVEGILGTYSPYYAPAPLDIYFLESFRDLSEGLAISRPVVFFSVPRFYEKVLEELRSNSTYRRFARMREGLRKRVVRRMIRNAVLRRTGLDRCAQMIVGSAPSSDEMIASFLDLGIEVHNAYGLTEAPLVTLNRSGRNRNGTVGEPLPSTEISIAPDGEILVKGPQVMAGYWKVGERPFRDGWLLTGDVGSLTEDGYLVVRGRKKEVIVTSYGKNIHPMKIESMLKDVEGVAEAMVVGDARPYCSAILWVDKEHTGEESFGPIDGAMEDLNERLSAPERLKRWVILRHNLSVESGLVTASFKLKRQEVERRLGALLDSLYDGNQMPPEVLHLGRARRS